MKVRCYHGFFMITETKPGQVSDYMSRTGLSIVADKDYFTFEKLFAAPDYSLEGDLYIGANATKTFEGKPCEVFEANGLVYNFDTGLVVPIASITQNIEIKLAGNRYISSGLIVPGSLTEDGERVRDYSAWFSRDTGRWVYTEVAYV